MDLNTEETVTPNKQGVGIDKMKRYGWITRDIAPGVFKNIPKGKLFFDMSYQREETVPATISAICREFSWLAFGVLTVTQRTDGTMYVVDGQNRLHAARRLSHIKEVPCLVFELTSVQQEALGFLDINTGRRNVSMYSRFKTMVRCGDKIAVAVNELILNNGRQPSRSSKADTVACLGLLMREYKVQPGLVQDLWPTIMDIAQGMLIHERVVTTLLYIERHLPDGESLISPVWHDRLKRLGADGVKNAADRAAAAYVKGGPKIWAVGVLEALNKGVRHRLHLSNNHEG